MSPFTPDQISRIDRLIRNNNLGLVYLVASDPGGPVKIGKSTFLGSRLDGLQIGNPLQLHVFAAFLAPRNKAIDLERRLQGVLAPFRLRGEWFSVSVAEAKAACRSARKTHPGELSVKISDVPRGQDQQKAKKRTSHAALKAIYQKHILEWSRRSSPDSSRPLSRNSMVRK